MISRRLTRRLEELEARIAPLEGEPLIVQVYYVTPDGGKEPSGPPIVIPMPKRRDRAWTRKGRWR